MQTVINWTRYDGTPETLPEDSGAYLLLCLGGKVYTGSFDDGRFNDIACAMWSITCGPCIGPEIGDLWAPWPEAPEAV